MLIVNAAGTQIREFRCTCPDYVKKRTFCEHCAALALEFLQEEQTARGPVSPFDLVPIEEEKKQALQEWPVEALGTAGLGLPSVEGLSLLVLQLRRTSVSGAE